MFKDINIANMLEAKYKEKIFTFGGIELKVTTLSLNKLTMEEEILNTYIKSLTLIRDGLDFNDVVKELFENIPSVCYKLIEMSTGLPQEYITHKLSLFDIINLLLAIVEVSIPTQEEIFDFENRLDKVSLSVKKLLDRNKKVFEKARKVDIDKIKVKEQDKPMFDYNDMV